jgi:hypothetical protein
VLPDDTCGSHMQSSIYIFKRLQVKTSSTKRPAEQSGGT